MQQVNESLIRSGSSTTKLAAQLALAVIVCLSATGIAAGVASAGDEAKPEAAEPLYITLGSYGVWGPRFEGSKRHDVSPWPIISWRNPSDKEWLDYPTDGLDFSLVETGNFRMGPVGYLRWQRDVGTIVPRGFARVGRGHSSIDLSLEGGMFAEYWPSDWLRTRVELREAFLGATGLLGILSTDAVWRPSEQWTIAGGPRLTLADKRFMESYYGVNFLQSGTSGLAQYSPSAGIRSYGAGAMVRYKISPSWTTQAFVDYQHLTGPAGDSPVISNRGTPEQVMVGVGLSYTFKAPW